MSRKVYGFGDCGCKYEVLAKDSIVFLTKTQYDALTEEEKNQDGIMYYVLDDGTKIQIAETAETIKAKLSNNLVGIEIVPSGNPTGELVQVLPSGSLTTIANKNYLLICRVTIRDGVSFSYYYDTITIPLTYTSGNNDTSYATINYGMLNSASSKYELETITLKVVFANNGSVSMCACYKSTSTSTVTISRYKVIEIV